MKVNLQKAVEAVKNGMELNIAAEKYGVKSEDITNAINPKGGDAPVDSFQNSRSGQEISISIDQHYEPKKNLEYYMRYYFNKAQQKVEDFYGWIDNKLNPIKQTTTINIPSNKK